MSTLLDNVLMIEIEDAGKAEEAGKCGGSLFREQHRTEQQVRPCMPYIMQ